LQNWSKEMFDLTGKKALVTGSSQGIGEAIATCFAAYGAEVFIHGQSREKCEAVAAKIGSRAKTVTQDLAHPDCAQKLYAQTGAVDILVMNASVQYRTKWQELGDLEFERQVRINFQSSFQLLQIYAPKMQARRWGRILAIGSVQQTKPHPQMPVYAATKAAQMNLVLNFAKQLAPFGITVNNLSPGVIATPRNSEALADSGYRERVVAQIPLGFEGRAQDCAGAALLLCSASGSYITGLDLIVDGGMHL
jgi:glucose 1-dehydrogenase